MAISEDLTGHLPFLRRYARALVHEQARGDRMVEATLRRLVAEGRSLGGSDARVALFRSLSETYRDEGDDGWPAIEGEAAATAVPLRRLAPMMPIERQAVLLHHMEGFTVPQVAEVLGIPPVEAQASIERALAEIDRQTRARVLIIEDEPIIAMDIESIIDELGHEVVGIAATRTQAVEEARAHRPGLVLADIQLADESSGIDAVQDILRDMTMPVIFITAFPERLLTGKRPEPTFLITKPFQTHTVKMTVAQALLLDPTTVPA